MSEPKITPEQYVALYGVLALDVHLWHDLADKLTCSEADALAEFLDAFLGEGVGASFLASHAYGDDEGDEHRLHDDRPLRERVLEAVDREGFPIPFSTLAHELGASTAQERNEIVHELHTLTNEGVLRINYGHGYERVQQ